MQMRGVMAWLCNFGNCHFIHTPQCLGEGAAPGCRIPALSSSPTTQLHRGGPAAQRKPGAPNPATWREIWSTLNPSFVKLQPRECKR